MVKKCKNGHWYDAKMYSYCPHYKRESEQLSLTIDSVEEDDKTVSIAEVDVSLGEELSSLIQGGGHTKTDAMLKASGSDGEEEDDDRTVSFGFFGQMGSKKPVVGWLVAVNGEVKGSDFRLHSGKNFIGRATSMDIVLPDDKTIARDKHGSVTYDPKGHGYYVAAENGNSIYCNDQVVESSQKLKEGDCIQLGETKLIFIPFCKEDRQWEEE